MFMHPKVSVIVPNYNHAPYLRQRLDSIFNQTFQDFEVIILDDCSTDKSKEIIEEYRNRPQVSHIVYNETNSGSPFKQWSKGLNLAQGEYIWIAESDDYCEAYFLEVLIPAWEYYPNLSIVESSSVYIDSCGVPLDSTNNYSNTIQYSTGISCIQEHLLCSNFFLPNASAVLFKKKLALNIPKNYESFSASGDRLFWIYLAEKGNVVKIDRPLNYFRQHNNKVSPIKEKDGTQCRENYKINLYLHSKGYVKGKYIFIEFYFYWNYIKNFGFTNEMIRKDLLHLWFNKWYCKTIIYRILKIYIRIKSILCRQKH